MMDRPSGLTHLTLDSVDIDVGFLPDICQGSWETLRELRIIRGTAVEMEDDVRAMLELCENLELLHCEGSDMLHAPSVFDDEEPLPSLNLRKLCLSSFDANPETLRVIAQACPKLEDLAILGRILRVSPDDWTSFISSGGLPSLRRLISPSGTNRPPFKWWSSDEREKLRRTCEARGIALASLAHKNDPLADW